MTAERLWEAAWTLRDGPLDSEEVAQNLFVAVGEVASVEPLRYDLNRRDQWRRYSARGLIVDVLTQRTQLVTIAEKNSVDEGGKLVVLDTGKQDQPPQAVVRWREPWPPPQERLAEVEAAASRAFDLLPLASFVLRVADDATDDPSSMPVRLERRSR